MASSLSFCLRKMFCSIKSLPAKVRYNSHSFLKLQTTARYSSSAINVFDVYGEKDPAPLFLHPDVTKILKDLTGCDLEKVFKNVNFSNPKGRDNYKFLTKEDLEEYMAKSYKKAYHFLQMPPILRVRKPISEVLSYDPALEGAVPSKMIFTDISFHIGDRNRIIVVREMDGTLRKANWEERDRMNQVYNPVIGRYHKVPKIFEDEHLQKVLNREEYSFVLDFACAHFQPDDELFHKVTSRAYEHINQRGKHEILHSTRHYGPMCFYLAWQRNIDNLLLKFIHEERLKEGVDLVKLYYLIQKDCEEELVQRFQRLEEESWLDFIKKYITEDATSKPNLHLALQAYQDLQERKKLENQMSLKV